MKRYNIVEVRFSLEIKSKSEIKILLFSSMTWDVMVDTSSSSSISVLRKRILPKKGRGRIFFIQQKIIPECDVSHWKLLLFIEWWGGVILYQALTTTLTTDLQATNIPYRTLHTRLLDTELLNVGSNHLVNDITHGQSFLHARLWTSLLRCTE